MGNNNDLRTWFIIFGDSGAGKTALQKSLAKEIAKREYKRLPSNLSIRVAHETIRTKYELVFFGGQSFQEQAYVENGIVKKYKTFKEYLSKFKKSLKSCPLVFLPSQLVSSAGIVKDFQEMFEEAKNSFQVDYVHALGLTNSLTNNPVDNAIKALPWDVWYNNEKVPVFENKHSTDKKAIKAVSKVIVDFLAR